MPGLQAAARTTLSPDVPQDDRPAAPGPATRAAASKRHVLTVLGVAAVVLIVDRITKMWAVEALADGRIIVIFDPWMQLRLVYNAGAAFGFAAGYTVIISLVAIGVSLVIVRMSRRLRNVWWAIALGGVLGGAVGNLIDRMTQDPGPFRGYVIDFIEWPGFPVWNIADASIVCSVALVFWLSLRNVPYDTEPGHRPTPDPDAEPGAAP